MELCRKNILACNIYGMLKRFPKEYNIFPRTCDFQAYTRAKKHKIRCTDTGKVWADIEDVVIKALVSAHSVLQHSYHTCFSYHAASNTATGAYFEILGFDVLIDYCLKPWLFEINHSTSFITDFRLDREVKDRLLYDMMVLINLGACDRRKATEEERSRIRDWLQHIRSKETQCESSCRSPMRNIARAGVRDWACWGSQQETRVKSTKHPSAPSIPILWPAPLTSSQGDPGAEGGGGGGGRSSQGAAAEGQPAQRPGQTRCSSQCHLLSRLTYGHR
uniref:tubulin polyglutamylase ttll6-like n=1 Tax=Oncorhynchus gorbuscha TaxID=8017 RepID=UPI001EAED61C|nr:tubulin polyglutamylase ttll6-like [Oncorhynchus gorbuscha]